MTIQDLEACGRYRQDIAAIDDSITRLRAEMERITQVMSLAPGRVGLRDKLASQVAKMQELEAERAGRVIAMEQYIDLCKAWLATLPEQQATILWLRHGENLKWSEVARRVGYTKHHCYKIYQAATKKMIPNDTFLGGKIVL